MAPQEAARRIRGATPTRDAVAGSGRRPPASPRGRAALMLRAVRPRPRAPAARAGAAAHAGGAAGRRRRHPPSTPATGAGGARSADSGSRARRRDRWTPPDAPRVRGRPSRVSRQPCSSQTASRTDQGARPSTPAHSSQPRLAAIDSISPTRTTQPSGSAPATASAARCVAATKPPSRRDGRGRIISGGLARCVLTGARARRAGSRCRHGGR